MDLRNKLIERFEFPENNPLGRLGTLVAYTGGINWVVQNNNRPPRAV
jgi:hypothetical protein